MLNETTRKKELKKYSVHNKQSLNKDETWSADLMTSNRSINTVRIKYLY